VETSHFKMHRSAAYGFTLLELMIAVLVVGILAAIAFPIYTEQVEKARRADAQAALLSFAQTAERLYSAEGTFAGLDGDNTTNVTTVSAPGTSVFVSEIPVDSSPKYYDIRVVSANENGYVLRASPKNAQAGDGNLEINSAGTRTWDQDGSGSLVAW